MSDDSVTLTSSSTTEGEVKKASKPVEFSAELLRQYYLNFFPYKEMYEWISYGNDPHEAAASQSQNGNSGGRDKTYFSRREWSFTIENDIYIRYQSFWDLNEFRDGIMKRQPHKIDIGAVFTAPPKQHLTLNTETFKPQDRELVFDIDITDYDEIRTCCNGADKICGKCWSYMKMAQIVLDRALRDDFGYENILWVFSGRRGIHCWVCDPEARQLPNAARSAVVDYLTVDTGNSNNFSLPMHPSLTRAASILEPLFEKYIVADHGQHIFTELSQLEGLPQDKRSALERQWEKAGRSSTSASRWEDIKAKIGNDKKCLQWKWELIFKHCYPRLDVNVSKMQNHLLKSPFCIHPKTGRVCVPLPMDDPESFDPSKVPTIRTLCEQFDSQAERTMMDDALELFNREFLTPMRHVNEKQRRSALERQSAEMVDF